MTPKHFLVPTDFSPYADQALTYAIELAHALDARLTLLHVFDLLHVCHLTPLTVEETPFSYFDAYLQEIESDAQQQMQASLAHVHRAGLRGDSVIVQGVVFDTIVEIARAKKADLIIMGTHGRTGVQHVLLGSVAERVVRLAPCPVLVVRRPTNDSPS